MRLPDPFVDAIAPGFTGARLIDNDPVIYDEMPNGKILKVKSSAQYWSLELTYPELFYEEFAYLSGFLAEVKRQQTTVDVLLPQYENFRVRGNQAALTIASGQSGNQITIGNTSIITGRPNIGDLFKISGGTKVYKITGYTEDTQANTMTLSLYPDLAHTTGVGETPIFNGILLEMTLVDDNMPDDDPDVDGLYRGFTFMLRETIDG